MSRNSLYIAYLEMPREQLLERIAEQRAIISGATESLGVMQDALAARDQIGEAAALAEVGITE